MNSQSRRTIHETTKIYNSSDIILIIIDGRNPLGSWSRLFENLNNEFKKKIIYVLNKSDLVPAFVIARWLRLFSLYYPTIAFHSLVKKSHGKTIVLNIIKQIRKSIYWKKKNLFVGVLGYPNVGKSSLINTLKGKVTTKSSPYVGETKTWKFIKLFKNIFLIDSPGIVLESYTNLMLCQIKKKIGKMPHGEISMVPNEIIDKISCKYRNKNPFNIEIKIPKNSLGSNKIKIFKNLKKGGEIDENKETRKKIKKFMKSNIPWYSPIPSFKKKIIKIEKFKFKLKKIFNIGIPI